MNNSNSDSFTTNSFSRVTKQAKLVLRAAIILIVVLGVAFAIRGLAHDIGAANQEIENKIEQLTVNLTSSTDADERRQINQQIEELNTQKHRWIKIHPGIVIAAAFMQFIGMALPGVFWQRVLNSFGKEIPLLKCLAIYFLGHLGRYVPGKAMVFVLRAGGLKHYDVSSSTSIISIFVETLILMAVGGTLGAISLIGSNPPTWLIIIAIAFAFSAAVPTLPPIFRRIIRILAKRRSLKIDSKVADNFGWRLFGVGWFLGAIGWLLVAVSTGLIVYGFGFELPPERTPLMLASACLAAATLSAVLGFISLIPSGIGVREMITTLVLLPFTGLSVALFVAIWMRIISMTAEFTWIGIGYFAGRDGRANN